MTDWKFKAGDVIEHKASGERCVVIMETYQVCDRVLPNESKKDIILAYTVDAGIYPMNFSQAYTHLCFKLVEAACRLVEEGPKDSGEESIVSGHLKPGVESVIFTQHTNGIGWNAKVNFYEAPSGRVWGCNFKACADQVFKSYRRFKDNGSLNYD